MNISRHLEVRSLHTYLNASALDELRDAATPPPAAGDVSGRSAQRFAMKVVACRRGPGTPRAKAHGQDIYAVSAPIMAEVTARLLERSFRRHGALALGQAFDAGDFLGALAPAYLAVELNP
jgi:hypothetical protein